MSASTGTTDDAVYAIARDAKLRAEAMAVVDALEFWARPMTPREVLVSLIDHAPTYGFADKEPGEWARIFDDHIKALAGMPHEAVEVAFVEWNRRGTYWPRPGDLYPAAARHAGVLRVAAYRAKKAAERAQYREERRKGITPEAKAELIAKGWWTPDGKPNIAAIMGAAPPPMEVTDKPRPGSPQDVAEALRRDPGVIQDQDYEEEPI